MNDDIKNTVLEMDRDSILEWLEEFGIAKEADYRSDRLAYTHLVNHLEANPKHAARVIND